MSNGSRPSLRRPPVAFAHRGARAQAPENTIEAFNLALELGATGLESDVWLTADGEAVLDHDGVVRRGLRRIPIARVNRDDLPGHIPSLDELYTSCGTGYELSLDVKDPRAFERTLEVARAHDHEARLWLCTDYRTAAPWRELTSARLVDSTRFRTMTEGAERRAAELARLGIDAVNLPVKEWSGGLVALFHRFDRYCLGWNAQFEREISSLLSMGIDGIFSDHVDRMMATLSSDSDPG